MAAVTSAPSINPAGGLSPRESKTQYAQYRTTGVRPSYLNTTYNPFIGTIGYLSLDLLLKEAHFSCWSSTSTITSTSISTSVINVYYYAQ